MRVQAGTAGALGDITGQRQHLALLVHWDATVFLGRPVEPADGGPLERADSCDLGGLEAFGTGELRQHRDRFITWLAHHHIRHHVRVLDDLRFHRQLLNPPLGSTGLLSVAMTAADGRPAAPSAYPRFRRSTAVTPDS